MPDILNLAYLRQLVLDRTVHYNRFTHTTLIKTLKINQLYETKAVDATPVCPRERLVIISKPTGLSFAIKRIGPLAAIIITVFHLLVFYLFAISKTSANLSASIYSESFIQTACQHLLLLVGFDTLIYQKYYDTPHILLSHQDYFLAPLPGIIDLSISSLGKYTLAFYLHLVFILLVRINGKQQKSWVRTWSVWGEN